MKRAFMRYAHRSVLALASVLILSVSSAEAVDGIKASATASREVPADILVVTFQISERAVPGEGAADQRTILTKALEEKGLKILEASTRYGALVGTYGGGQSNVISSTGSVRDAVEVRKTVAFRVTGFKRIDDVLDIVGRHGVRQNLSLIVDHSKAEAIRQELQKEAIARAIAQARSLAATAGVKTGGVVDLATHPGYSYLSGTAGTYAQIAGLLGLTGTDQTLIDPVQPGELPRLKFSVTANVVLGIKSD